MRFPFAHRTDSAGQRRGKEKKKKERRWAVEGKKRRENDENAVMAARAEGQARMLWKRTKHSKRDGRQRAGRRDGEEEENSSSWLRAKR